MTTQFKKQIPDEKGRHAIIAARHTARDDALAVAIRARDAANDAYNLAYAAACCIDFGKEADAWASVPDAYAIAAASAFDARKAAADAVAVMVKNNVNWK